MYRGFARSLLTEKLQKEYTMFIESFRAVCLAPFTIILALACIYLVVKIIQLFAGFILVRADFLRENPFAKVPLVECYDRWEVLGLNPNFPKDAGFLSKNEKFTLRIMYEQAPLEFEIREKKKRLHNMLPNDHKNFFIRCYNIERGIQFCTSVKRTIGRRFKGKLHFRNPGVYWVEVLYCGVPVGNSPYEVDVLYPSHPWWKKEGIPP